MIQARFQKQNGKLTGFEISGHAGVAARGKDVACAAVSSAVQLTVNLLAEFGCKPEASAAGSVKCRITDEPDCGDRIIARLMAHLGSILEEFPKSINITISEV